MMNESEEQIKKDIKCGYLNEKKNATQYYT